MSIIETDEIPDNNDYRDETEVDDIPDPSSHICAVTSFLALCDRYGGRLKYQYRLLSTPHMGRILWYSEDLQIMSLFQGAFRFSVEDSKALLSIARGEDTSDA